MKYVKGPAHVALMTADLEASIAFYEKLGGKVFDRGTVQKPAGASKLAMLHIAGYDLELIESATGLEGLSADGVFAHLAFEVEDVEAAAAEVRALGITSFMTEEKVVLPELFGGVQNIFFTGPSGEQIELLQKL